MAVTDQVFITSLGFIIVYITVFRMNQLIGSFAFLALSAILMSSSNSTLVSGTGIVMIAASIISIVYNLLPKPKPVGKRR